MLKETAINYFSEISKNLRSKMQPIIPMIVEPILEATKTQEPELEVIEGKEFDLDSDDSDDE